jgi:hypothetical protein
LYSVRKASGETVFEVGYKDSENKQRWRRTGTDLAEAKALRDELTGARA